MKKISGQIQGIEKMIDSERSCSDIIQQIIAVRSALASLGIEIVTNQKEMCSKDSKPEEIAQLVKDVFKLS